MIQYAVDYPINEISEDRFQRQQFSNRIAETIYNYQNNKSLVIGLYGKWGSGKSSVLNLIQTHIEIIDTQKEIIVVKFNPWRFSDEKSLLLSFLNVFAKAIDVELKEKKEKLSETISKYADALAIIPISGINKTVKAISDSFVQDSVEELKLRLDKAIQSVGEKILVVIDDIDRLDKNEIYSILRLVKLNADFPNSIYLLSFDEEMVAEAIGERFGKTGKEAGRNFLEKIIQVPLYLPKLLQSDLINYSFNEITKVINSLELGISNNDIESFPSYFRDCISLRIETPRLVIRYINSIRFSLPLLNKEVNMSDLLLIEAIKIFYPSHYQYIKENPSYFLKQYMTRTNDYFHSNIDEEKEFVKNKLDELSIDFDKEEKNAIFTLLKHLFPYLESLIGNVDNSAMYDEWLKNKRICTAHYHERYFIYTVLKGDLSDCEFDKYINDIPNMEENKVAANTYQLIEQSSQNAFLTKLQINKEDFSETVTNKITLAICTFGDKLSTTDGFSPLFSSQRQYARIVVEMTLKSSNCFLQLKKILNNTDSIIFLQEIWDILTSKNKENNILNETEINVLAWILINRAKKESKRRPMFEIDYIHTYTIFNLWYKLDTSGFTKYIHRFLEKKPARVLSILIDNADHIKGWAEKEYRRCSISKNGFERMKSIYDLDYLYDCIEKAYPNELGKEPIWKGETEEVKDDLIYIGQFLYYYREDKNNQRIYT